MSVPRFRFSVRLQAVLATVVLLAFLTLITVIIVSCLPVLTHTERQRSSGEWQISEMPFIEFHPATLKTNLRLTLYVPPRFVPDRYVIRYRDTILSFRVNGVELASTISSGALLRLGSYLQEGDNDIQATVAVTTEPSVVVFALEPSIWNQPLVVGIVLTVLAFCLWLFFLRRIGIYPLPRSLLWIVFAGILLRVLYTMSTPVHIRAYDWGGHLEYIFYLLDHHAFPRAGELWQGHQAPLFYLLETPLALLGRSFGWDTTEIAILLRIFPLFLSIVTLLVGLRIVLRVFPNTASRVVGTLLLSAFPTLLYFSSQVNNDVLLTFIGFLWFERLLLATETGSRRHWTQVGLLCGLGLLTKANALPWVAISFFLAALSHKHWRLRVYDIATISVSALLGGGWWYVVQAVLRDRFSVVANAFEQVGLVKLQPLWSEFLTFNPIYIIHHPSVGITDPLTRPQFLLETLFRSSQLGSVYFNDDANILIVLALLLLAWMLVGVYAEVRARRLVNVATILILILASALFRLKYPFATAQHFRYIAVAVVPLVLLTVRGISVTRMQLLRVLGEMTAVVYALFVAIIILSVAAFS